MSDYLKLIEAARKSKYAINEIWIYECFVRPVLPNVAIEDENGGLVGFDTLDYTGSFKSSDQGNIDTLSWNGFKKHFLGVGGNAKYEEFHGQAQSLYEGFKDAWNALYLNPETQNLLFGTDQERYDEPYSLAGRSVYQSQDLIDQVYNSGDPQETFNDLKQEIAHFKIVNNQSPRSGGFQKSHFQSEAIKMLRSLVLSEGSTYEYLKNIKEMWAKLISAMPRANSGRKASNVFTYAKIFDLFIQHPLIEYDPDDPDDMSLEWSYSQFQSKLYKRFKNVEKYFKKFAEALTRYAKSHKLGPEDIEQNIPEIANHFSAEIELIVKTAKISMRNDLSDKKKLFKQRGTMLDPASNKAYQTDSMHEYAIIDILSIYGYAFAAEVDVPMIGVDGEVLIDNRGQEVKKRVDFAFPNGKYLEVFGVERKDVSSKKQQHEKSHEMTQLTYDENKKLKMREWKGELYYVDTTGNDSLFPNDINKLSINIQRPLTLYCDLLDNAAFFDQRSGAYANTGLLGNRNHKDQFLKRFSLLVGEQNEIAVNFYRLWANDSMGPEQLYDYVNKVSWMREYGTQEMKPYEYFNAFPQNPDVVVPYEQLSPLIPEDVIQRAQNQPKLHEAPQNVAEAFGLLIKEAQQANTVDIYHIPGLPKMKDIKSGLGGFYSVVNGIASEFEMVAMYFATLDNLMPYIQQIIQKLDEYMQMQNQPVGYIGQNWQQTGVAADSWVWEIKTAQRMGDTELTKQIRNKIKSDPFFHKLFNLYGVGLEKVDTDLECQKADLGTRNAKNKGNKLYFNNSLFEDEDFFENGIHYIVHEITHWLTNQREEQCYFADPEEMQAFTLGIAYEIFRGIPKRNIYEVYFPIIEKHFSCRKDAKQLFSKFYTSALKMQEKFK